MKFTWELNDIQPGVKFGRADITEVWILGWFSDETLIANGRRYAFISLEDGMITKGATREELVEMLNSAAYIPVKYMVSIR